MTCGHLCQWKDRIKSQSHAKACSASQKTTKDMSTSCRAWQHGSRVLGFQRSPLTKFGQNLISGRGEGGLSGGWVSLGVSQGSLGLRVQRVQGFKGSRGVRVCVLVFGWCASGVCGLGWKWFWMISFAYWPEHTDRRTTWSDSKSELQFDKFHNTQPFYDLENKVQNTGFKWLWLSIGGHIVDQRSGDGRAIGWI